MDFALATPVTEFQRQHRRNVETGCHGGTEGGEVTAEECCIAPALRLSSPTWCLTDSAETGHACTALVIRRLTCACTAPAPRLHRAALPNYAVIRSRRRRAAAPLARRQRPASGLGRPRPSARRASPHARQDCTAHSVRTPDVCGPAASGSIKPVDCGLPDWLPTHSYVPRRTGDGPLSVRGCPSTVKGTRRSFLTASQKWSSGPTLERRSLCTPPVRDQGPGRSLPGPDAGHPLQGAGWIATGWPAPSWQQRWEQQLRPTACGSDQRQRWTLARSVATWDMSGLKNGRSVTQVPGAHVRWKGTKSHVKNRLCKPICKPDAAG